MGLISFVCDVIETAAGVVDTVANVVRPERESEPDEPPFQEPLSPYMSDSAGE